MTKAEAKENFGRRVRSPSRLWRHWFDIGGDDSARRWVVERDNVEGLLIGVRIYWDFEENVIPWGEEETIKRKRTDSHVIALIVPNRRENPIPVPLEDCELVKYEL